MKQIKTIKYPMQHPETFDAEVNTALKEGWQLIKREVLGPIVTHTGEPNVYIVLYAELEREVVTEPERCCENCRYFDNSPGQEPCCSCGDGEIAPTNWEPAT